MPCHVGSCLFFYLHFLSLFVFLFLTFPDVFNTRWSLWNHQSFAKVAPLFRFAVSSLISGRRIVLTEQCLMVLRMLPAILGLANVCPFPDLFQRQRPCRQVKKKTPPVMPERRPHRRRPWTWPNCENMHGDTRRAYSTFVALLAPLPTNDWHARKGKWKKERGRTEANLYLG
jgi:hypothetical protein